jgi:hypothetical protein
MSRGEFVREADVYQAWKRQLDLVPAERLVERLKDFGEHARYYERIVNPEKEPEPAISAAFGRLNRWGAQTIYPFLLFAYGEYAAGAVDGLGFANLLGIVESFLVRRLFAGVPTNALNRLFLRLGEQLPEGIDLLEGTMAVLSQPSRRWPKDEEFRQGVLRYPLYTDSRPDQRRLILETFEKSHRHKEAPELVGLTVEHLMPQALTQEWRQELGPEAERVHAALLHVLGNLTLTGYNPELSNSPWADKRRLLLESNLQMNKEIAKVEAWGEAQILQRGDDLAEQASKLWTGPVTDGIEGGTQSEEVVLPAQWANFYQSCIDRLEPFLKVKLLRKTTTVLASDDGTCAVVCLVSREYNGRSYWWTFRSTHQEALAGASKSFLALGCGSADQLLTIPFTDWQSHLDALSSVTRGNLVNWQVHVHREGKELKLHRKGGLPDVDLTRYLLGS